MTDREDSDKLSYSSKREAEELDFLHKQKQKYQDQLQEGIKKGDIFAQRDSERKIQQFQQQYNSLHEQV